MKTIVKAHINFPMSLETALDSNAIVDEKTTVDYYSTGLRPRIGGRVRCSDTSHHWASLIIYVGMKSEMDCVDLDDGKTYKVHQICHGGGLAVGIYNYMEGYKAFKDLRSLKALEGSHSMVCIGLSATLGWSFMGPAERCFMTKDGKVYGIYIPTNVLRRWIKFACHGGWV